MLKEMGDAGFALRLVRGADAIPHHVRDDRHAVIGQHHDLHAVFELEGLSLETAEGERRRRREESAAAAPQKARRK